VTPKRDTGTDWFRCLTTHFFFVVVLLITVVVVCVLCVACLLLVDVVVVVVLLVFGCEIVLGDGMRLVSTALLQQ
jgi:hypothetical protein